MGVAALAFLAAALAVLVRAPWARGFLLAAALFSLALTGLDWNVAYAGAALDLLIVGVLVFVWKPA